MKQRTITAYQSFIMVIMTVAGMGVLVFPRNIGKVFGRDGIWVTFFAIVLVSLIIYLMTLLGQWYPRDSFVEYTEKILGSKRFRWLGKWLHLPFLLAFAFIWFSLVTYVARGFSEVVVLSILPQTPLEIIMLIFLLTAAIVASYPSEVIVKFNELLFPFFLIPVVFLLIALVQNGELINFFPLFQFDWKKILMGASGITADFAGYSIILILMVNYQQPEKAVKSHLLAFLLTGLIFWLCFAVSLGSFGLEEMNRLTLPTLETIRLVNTPLQILERLESITIALWMVASFTTLANILYALVELIRRKLKKGEVSRKWISLLVVTISFVVAMIPQNLDQLFEWISQMNRVIFVIDITIPLLLVIIAWLRKKRGKKNETSAIS